MPEEKNFKNKKAEQEIYSVEPVIFGEAEAVWKIRNDSEVRKNFHSAEEIPLEHHKEWFKNQYFRQEDNKCFVLKEGDSVVGYCRFDFKNNKYLVSIAISPDCQGRGLGRKLLAEGIEALGTKKEIIAEVKKNNEGSVQLFRKCGFSVFNQDENLFSFKYTPKKQ
jgi:ribosomal protein S18 acetylase RimI-like enzyme